MFGSTPFGGFGSSTAGTGLFGQSTGAQPQQQQAPSLFGGGATPSFGGVAQQTPPAFGFGATTTQAQSPSVFGQQPATGGLFGGTPSLFSAAAQPQQAGTSTRFVAPTGQESVMKNGVTTTVSTRNQVITMMKEYEAKSFEELRLEDYQANRKGPQAAATTGLFGTSTAVQPQSSLFGTNTTSGGSSFGLFGQSNATSTSTNLFGSQPKPIFGSGATTTPSFGGTTTGFQFNPTSQAQPQSIFGASNAATTTPAAPTAFSFTPQQPPTTTLWGQKPATQTGTTPAPAFGTGLFGSTSTSTAAPSKPLFGSGSLFGTSSTAAATSQPAFGTATTTPSIFSNSASTQQPAKPFGFSFPSTTTTTTAQPLFGTNPSAAPVTTNLFGTPNAATAPGAFSFGTSAQPATTPSFGFSTSGFGASTGTASPFTSGFQQQQPPPQQQQCFPSSQVQPYVPFATTPYKDNPIFYNLFSNRKLEEMTKPTNPLAMHEFMDSLRKKSSSPASLSWKRGYNTVPHPPRRSSSVSICKFEIWNGFDDDAGVGGSPGVNILVPKQNKEWKRLVLNSAPTTPLSCASCAKMTPPGKISPLSRSLNLSDSSPSRWLKSGGLVKQRTRLNLNALSSEFEFEENRNGDPQDSSGFINLSDSLSLAEGRRLSSTPRFRIAAILEEDEEIKRGTAEKEEGAGDFAREEEKKSPSPAKSCGVLCSRAGYYIKPSVEELDKLVDGNGHCFVDGFEVGRRNFGKIKFLEAVNVAGINVDKIVFFRHKEVVVYPDDEAKPPLYEGLNVPAEIELERVWPIDKATNEAIRCLKKIEELQYEEKLKKACVRLGAEFLAYDGEECVWKFRVAHFSKYSCDLEEQDEGDEEKNSSTTSKNSKSFSISETGLGGIPQKVMALLSDHVVGPGGDAGGVTPPEVVASPHLPENLLNNVISIGDFWGETEEELPHTPAKRSRAHGKLDLSDFSTPPQSIYSLIWPDEEPSSPRNHRPFKGRIIREIFQVPASAKPLLQPPPSQPQQQDKPKPPPEPQEETMMEIAEPLKSMSLKVDEPEDVFARLKTGEAVNVKLEGCPRVCFLPRGNFLTINQRVTAATGFSAQMEISQFYSYEKLQESFIFSEPYRAVLTKQMENRFRVRQATLFREHIEIIQNQLKYTSFAPIKAELEEELCVWQLCDILWPPKEFDDEVLQDSGYPLTQRISLSKWLVDNASILFGDEFNQEDNSVLALLKKGLVEKACEAALAQGNYFLAILIATEPHLLLDFDEELFDQETSAIFALISGSLHRFAELTPEKLSGSSAHEWFQYFALFIWYHGPAQSSLLTPVNEAVREYEALMRTISGTDETSPFPSHETSTIANLCMELLKLFSCPSGYPLPRLLRPRTWTEDFLDYKLVWLLLRDFEEMRFHTEDETYFELCLNFANQLEAIGMWTWAIFVVKNIVPNPYEDDKDEWAKLYKKRDAFYLRLLERNINQDRMDDYFLVNRLGIKEKLLYSVKNWKSELAYEKIWYLGRIGKWQRSLEMLVNYLIGGNGLALVAEENNASGYSRNVFDYLRSLRRKCKAMESWETGGKMLYDYSTFKMIQVRDAGKEKKEEDELLQIVTNFLDSVTKFQPSGMNNCALLLEMVVSVQKVVQCLFTSAEIESPAKEQFYESLQQFFKLPIPPEYLEGLRNFIDANWSFITDENMSA